jgi:hypothetical protein
MKKTYFDAPALELVKVQTMQMIAASGEPVDQGDDDQEASSHGFHGILEDDTEEE